MDLQRDALKRAGCIVVHEETVSGAAKRRPMLDLAIKELRPGDTLLVWRLDRIARSVTQLYKRLEEIDAQQAEFRSLTEGFDLKTAGGKFLLGVLALVAEFERQLTIERTRAGVAARQARGLPHGAPIKFTDKKRALARKLLRNKKLKRHEIAKRCGISPQTLYLWIKAGMPPVGGQK